MQPTPGKTVFVRALVILNFDINCHFYTRHILVQNIGYRSTWSVISAIGIGPEKRISVDPYYSPPRPLCSQNSGNLIIPRISKSTAGGRSFSYLAPKLWNNLPNTVREADTLCQFKSRLKTHLFNLAYTTH